MAAGGVETARLNRKGVFLSPHIGLGVNYVYEGMTITPALRMRYMAHFLDGARESATNGLVLDDATLGLFEARAELAVARRFDNGFTLRAKFGAIYDTQVSGDRNAATVAGLRLSLPQDVRGLGAGAFGSVGLAFEAGAGTLVFAEAEGVAKSNGVTGFGGRAGVQIKF
jgi:outer membrane autotransporter protein